jgi:hypothetical protein
MRPRSSVRQDLWHQHLWRWLDADAKAALRVVSKGMRSQVDSAVGVVASPSSSASANDRPPALACRARTLLNVSDATALAPLSTASLAGLTSLTVREEVGLPCGRMGRMGAHPMRACMARAHSLTPSPSHGLGAWFHVSHAWLLAEQCSSSQWRSHWEPPTSARVHAGPAYGRHDLEHACTQQQRGSDAPRGRYQWLLRLALHRLRSQLSSAQVWMPRARSVAARSMQRDARRAVDG